MVTLQSVYHARRRIAPHITRTPLIPAPSLGDAEREVRLKLETTQPMGAFKLRGAINALANLDPEQRQRGVVCASTGNHGRALAYAARMFRVKAVVCMSSLVPENKVKAIEKLGAHAVIHGNSQDDAQLKVNELVSQQGMCEIPPFDHLDVIAGQGTIGLEILEDWPEVDTILVGLSGGGLLGGIALAAKSINPAIQVIGLSPRRGAAMAASLAAQHPVEVEELPTLADSLGGGIGLENRYTFNLVQQHINDLLLLDEAQIAAGMRHLYFNEALISEGAGAVGAALLVNNTLLDQLKQPLGKHIALIVSGRNVDMQQFTRIMGGQKD